MFSSKLKADASTRGGATPRTLSPVVARVDRPLQLPSSWLPHWQLRSRSQL